MKEKLNIQEDLNQTIKEAIRQTFLFDINEGDTLNFYINSENGHVIHVPHRERYGSGTSYGKDCNFVLDEFIKSFQGYFGLEAKQIYHENVGFYIQLTVAGL